MSDTKPKPVATKLTMNDLMAHEPVSYSSGNGLVSIVCQCGTIFHRPWGHRIEPAVEQREHRLFELNKIVADFSARIEREAREDERKKVSENQRTVRTVGGQ